MLDRFIGANNTARKRLLVLIVSLVTIWLVFQVSTGGLFFTPRNFYNLAVQSSVVAVLTIGMVIVIATKNIDLSVGSLLGLVGMVVAVLQIRILPPDVWWNTPVTILVALVLGALLGLWQGFLVAYFKIPSFVVTLSGLLIFRGISTEVARGETVSPFLDSYRIFGGGAKGSIGETWSWIVAAILIAAIAFGLLRTLVAKSENKRFRVISMIAAVMIVLFITSMFNAYDMPRTDLVMECHQLSLSCCQWAL
jgi:D-xylose transport system permease protein